MARLARLGSWLLVVLAVGCGGEPAGATTWLELGAGEWRFEPVADGDEVPMIYGSQGGYHVWASMRTEGMVLGQAQLEVETQPADESRAPNISRVTVQLREDGQTGLQEFLGWPAVLAWPGCVDGELLRLRVTLTDRHGVTGTDERYLRPVRRASAPAPGPC